MSISPQTRSLLPFPLEKYSPLIDYLQQCWQNGLFDEYSEQHFLIRALKNEIQDFIGIEQHINNNINMYGFVDDSRNICSDRFCPTFCFNLSMQLNFLATKFGKEKIDDFIKNQMAAGKHNYNENAFFEALSEIHILRYFCINKWDKYLYEPVINNISNAKNPEAKFISNAHQQTVCVEVKCPCFPQIVREEKLTIIPCVLLTDIGRNKLNEFCIENQFKLVLPRINKIVDFINSASSKFAKISKGEYNFLYINWSFSDYPKYSFLEAWGLLMNPYNGLLTCQSKHKLLNCKIASDFQDKISAIIVFTESVEEVAFNDFRYVWQTEKQFGPRFRMCVVDENLKTNSILNPEDNELFNLTKMNHSTENPLPFLISNNMKGQNISCGQIKELKDIIINNVL